MNAPQEEDGSNRSEKRSVEFDVKGLISVDSSSFLEEEKRSRGRLVWNPENKEKYKNIKDDIVHDFW